MQLAWGHVKTLEGYPELQDIYDLGQTRMSDVIARLCARAFSADGATIPPALRFARAGLLTAALKGRQWGTEVDFCSDGDACVLSYIEGGSGTQLMRIPRDNIYTDISQVLRVRRIGTNVLAFFGIRDGPTHSWRQAVSSCEHAFQGVPASDAVKRTRLGKAMQRFLTRALDDVGKRVDLVRYSAKHDAVGPRALLHAAKGGPADEFAESVARIQEDQKRKRSAVADDVTTIVQVRLPAEERAHVKLGDVLRETASKSQKQVAIKDPTPKSPPTAKQQESGSGKWTTLELIAKVGSKATDGKISISVDKAGALRWLHDHGVQRACLGFLFGHACPGARQWKSCPHPNTTAHTQELTGPHKVVEGWKEAAVEFVKPSDRHHFSA